MKKKVYYAAGAVAAAVPVLGLMTPAVAAPAQKVMPNGKTVSLRHLSVTAAPAECTGTKKVVQTNTQFSVLRFWWTKSQQEPHNACIGTVEGYIPGGLAPGEGYWRLRIYDFPGNEGSKIMSYSHHFPVTNRAHQSSWTVGIHESFGWPPVQVCAAFVLTPGGVHNTPICHSVS
jgi:hypothetical protein